MIQYMHTLWNVFKAFFFCYWTFKNWNIIDFQHLVPGAHHSDSYFCTLQNDHHHKSSYRLSPYKVITILLTYSPCCMFHPRDSFICNWKFVPLNLPHLFLSSPTPFPLATTCFFSVSMTLFLFCYVCSFVLFLDSTYKWNHMVFVFLLDLFHLA